MIVQVAPPARVAGGTGQLFVWVKFVLAVIAIVVAVLARIFHGDSLRPRLLSPRPWRGKEALAGVAVTVVAPLGVP